MNSDTCLSYFDESLYRACLGISTILLPKIKIKKIKKIKWRKTIIKLYPILHDHFPRQINYIPRPYGIFQHSLSLWTQQTILTCKRIYIIQQPQSYCKPLEQLQIESNITNSMHDSPFTRLLLEFWNTFEISEENVCDYSSRHSYKDLLNFK